MVSTGATQRNFHKLRVRSAEATKLASNESLQRYWRNAGQSRTKYIWSAAKVASFTETIRSGPVSSTTTPSMTRSKSSTTCPSTSSSADLPCRVTRIHQAHLPGYPLTTCFYFCMVQLHQGGTSLETKVIVSLDMLRRLRDAVMLDDLTGQPVQVAAQGENMNVC